MVDPAGPRARFGLVRGADQQRLIAETLCLPKHVRVERRRFAPAGALLGILGLATTVLSSWGLVLLTFPGASLPPGLFADVWGLRAVDAAEAPVDLPALDEATAGGVRAAPLDAAAWLRRAAYARALGGGRLTFETAYALRRSWRLAPLNPDIAVSRLELAFELWPDLAAADRAAASRELEAMWRGTRLRADLQRIPDQISSPAGRLACGLLLAEFQGAP